MTPTPTTIVEVMKPQPTYMGNSGPVYVRMCDRCIPSHTEYDELTPSYQPGDHITRDGKRLEVVSVGCKQVGDLTTTQVRTVYPDWEYRDAQWPDPDDWAWVYEVKGVGDEE